MHHSAAGHCHSSAARPATFELVHKLLNLAEALGPVIFSHLEGQDLAAQDIDLLHFSWTSPPNRVYFDVLQ